MTGPTPTAHSVPRLRRGVRLGFDDVRSAHVVLFPEGVLVANATAAAVLELCDGATGVAAITAALGRRYTGVREEEVIAVLARFGARGVVEWS